MPIDTDALKAQLNEGWARVEFTKVDGTHRSMLCTRNFAEIPVDDAPKGVGKKPNDALISVYDLEKLAWRSIRLESIESWTEAVK